MSPLGLNEIAKYIEDNIGIFHSTRLEKINKLKLHEILKRKNPYLYKAKNILLAQDIVKVFLDAYLSSQEEAVFGGFLEQLAIFTCNKVFGGTKSAVEGIDLEFENKKIKYIVSIKSGPHWGNSRQVAGMRRDFDKAKRILRTNAPAKNVVAVCGCCYGRDINFDKGDFLKLCGQRFWEMISGNKDLYINIIEPLGHKAKERNEKFIESYSQIINKFTIEFTKEFCEDGKINWEKLVKYNSSADPPQKTKLKNKN
jgi:hypothetical protein